MTVETLEKRLIELESRVRDVEERLPSERQPSQNRKSNWRWFVGIYENSTDFDDVVRLGQEWRNVDRSIEDEITTNLRMV